MSTESLSVVVSVYNESNNLFSVLDELNETIHLKFLNYEIIVVNDGSEDGSKYIIDELSNLNKNIFPLHLDKNYGQSYAIFEGIKVASFDKIVIMDGDGQYNPKDIPIIFEMLKDDIRLVSGIRDNRKDPFLYRKASLIGNFLIARFFNMHTFDLGCGLKIGYKNDLLRMPYFKHIHRYFQIIYHNSNLPIAQTIIDHRSRLHGKSKYSLMKVFNIIPRLIWMKFKNIKLGKSHE